MKKQAISKRFLSLSKRSRNIILAVIVGLLLTSCSVSSDDSVDAPKFANLDTAVPTSTEVAIVSTTIPTSTEVVVEPTRTIAASATFTQTVEPSPTFTLTVQPTATLTLTVEPSPTFTLTVEPSPTFIQTVKPSPIALSEATQAPETSAPIVEIIDVNKDAEYVDIQNKGNSEINLSGWNLVSEKGNQECPLSGTLNVGETLRIWTKAAQDTGYSCGYATNIWNNSESDPAVLYNPEGVEVSRY